MPIIERKAVWPIQVQASPQSHEVTKGIDEFWVKDQARNSTD
jgi:hypothetical protein